MNILMIQKGLDKLCDAFEKALRQAKKRNYDQMSADDKIAALSSELKELEVCGYFYVMDLFEDSVIVKAFPEWWEDSEDAVLLKIPYSISENVASFGSPIEVERVTTYQPISDASEPSEAGNQSEQIEYKELSQSHPILLNSVHVLQFDKSALEQAKASGSADGLSFQNAVLTTFCIKNANGQYYPQSVWEKNLAILQERAANNMLIGEADHPTGPPSIERQCIKFDSLQMQGNTIVGSGKIIPTRIGKDLIAQAMEGIPIALSSRGYGSVKLQSVDGMKLMVVQDDFQCETFDAVWKPAAGGSYITEFGQGQGAESEQPTLTQTAIEIGEKPQMNKVQKEIAKIQGMIDFLQAQGKNVEHFQKQLDAIAQMENVGASEDEILAILGPFKGGMTATSGETPADPDKDKNEKNPARMVGQSAEPAVSLNQAELAANKEMLEDRDAAIENLVQGYDEKTKKMFQGMLKKYKTVDEVINNFEVQQSTLHRVLGINNFYSPVGIGMTAKEAKYEQAPKTAQQAIDKLCEGIPEAIDQSTGLPANNPSNQKENLRKYMQNIVKATPRVGRDLVLQMQGRDDLLNQAGEISIGNFAATYADLLPIIRKAWPKLFLPAIASIQVIDRPSADVYFLDSQTDQGSSFNNYYYYTYADGIAERGTAKNVQFVLTKQNIVAYAKKLKTTQSYEVIQDLRAQYGMDGMSEALEICANEIAREWNNQGLYDMMTASGTSGNVTFGKTAPSGYTQTEWEQGQLRLYLQTVSGNIFKNRQGPMTHILAGPTACVQLAKLGGKYGFNSAQGDESNVFSGINLFGTINSDFKVFQCQALDDTWGINKLLCLRKGPDWSDSAYIFAPYTAEIEPPKHGVNGDFTVTQGLMSRAAKLVAVPGAIGTLTFSATTGTAL